jgi:hypothetical protein
LLLLLLLLSGGLMRLFSDPGLRCFHLGLGLPFFSGFHRTGLAGSLVQLLFPQRDLPRMLLLAERFSGGGSLLLPQAAAPGLFLWYGMILHNRFWQYTGSLPACILVLPGTGHRQRWIFRREGFLGWQ